MLPEPDRDSAPWWEALRAHRLLVQRCRRCEVMRFPFRSMCNRCGSREWTDVEVSGDGTVLSWVVNHHVFSRAFADRVPYDLARVQLVEQDDVVLVGNLVDVEPGAIRAGLPVRAVFDDVSPDVCLLRWQPR